MPSRKNSSGRPSTSSRKARAVPRAQEKSVRVRMYRHGLGDCFLLTFPTEADNKHFHVLIDCGLIGVASEPKIIMKKVASDIKAATAQHLDLVVITHEHWDHVSGFSTQQAQEVFDTIPVDQVWYAWTEDTSPKNELGRRLRKEREAKARAVHKAALALRGIDENRAKRLGALLTFFGITDAAGSPLAAAAEGGTTGKVRQAFDYMATRKGVKIRYCRPTDKPTQLPGVPNVRVYVLGPPEDEKFIKRSDPTKTGQEVYEFASGLAMDEHLMAAFSRHIGDANGQAADERDFPFDAALRRKPGETPVLQALAADTWDKADEDWRRIENDWMATAETLALALDKHTNNTCLVIAFELIDTGRVLLFAADAQVGNWLSWQDLRWEVREGNGTRAVTGPNLLERTVLYKVGHHGSHNATLRDKGLEQMTSPELVALVPVDKGQAEKNRWFAMPFNKLMERLREKTRGRVVVSDPAVTPPAAADLKELANRENIAFRKALRSDPNGLYHDLFIPL